MKNKIIRPNKQIYEDYTEEDFKVWKLLFNRQIDTLRDVVAIEFLDSLKAVGFKAGTIPKFDEVNKRLYNLTGWKTTTVPNIADSKEFFYNLSKKRFTTTCWLRSMEEIDYLEEPDMFHDVFAHVPLLSNKSYTEFFYELGNIGVSVINKPDKLLRLQRLYWFTIEFGLIRSKELYKIYGAGIISSKEECKNAMYKNSIKRQYDVSEIMNEPFRTDQLQEKYFVIDSFQQLTNSIEEIRNSI